MEADSHDVNPMLLNIRPTMSADDFACGLTAAFTTGFFFGSCAALTRNTLLPALVQLASYADEAHIHVAADAAHRGDSGSVVLKRARLILSPNRPDS